MVAEWYRLNPQYPQTTAVENQVIWPYLLSRTLHSCLQKSRFLSNGVRINFCSSSSLSKYMAQSIPRISHILRSLTINVPLTRLNCCTLQEITLDRLRNTVNSQCQFSPPLQKTVSFSLLQNLRAGVFIPLRPDAHKRKI